MQPFHKSSLDPNSVDTETPTGQVSPENAPAHKNLSSRVLDAGPVTREDDLERGALLRDMDTGVEGHDDEAMHYLTQGDLDPVPEGEGQPDADHEFEPSLLDINKRADKRKPHEEQWQRLYRVIFPHQERCHEPFWDVAEVERMIQAHDFFHSPTAQDLLGNELEQSVLQDENITGFHHIIYERYLPLCFAQDTFSSEQNYPTDVPGGSRHHNDQTAEPVYASQSLDLNESNIAVSYAMGSPILQHASDPAAIIQAFPVLGFDENVASTLRTVDSHLSFEGLGNWVPPNTTENWGQELAGFETDILDASMNCLELEPLIDDAFFLPLPDAEDAALGIGKADGFLT
ncbi:hypothetical protein G7Z17_g320 [Cylindrodendrum hubeiense]|uniref:Uncharacterized protein n=1 Tax=Cylindrodendrum hubeiense TaxID=595255 RepID=A0A9P5HSH0_9HYPO|nr:hypothetical protein G7Z17_g320 [Cylindrodendrum hubeiense]